MTERWGNGHQGPGSELWEPAERSDMAIVLAGGLVLISVLVALWDFGVLALGYRDDTVSAILNDWCHREPVVAFLLGLLAGHVIWSRPWRVNP